jgi:hypothetical protein
MPQIEIKHEKESDGSQAGSQVLIEEKTKVVVEPE